VKGRHAVPAGRPAGGLIALLAGLLVLAGGTIGITAAAWHDDHAQDVFGRIPHVAVPHGPIAAVPGPARTASGPAPVFLIIPAIGVRTRLVKLGITASGAMAVPATTKVAGWYTKSPRPGAIGPAVIAGHVDSYHAEGVFFRLRRLRPGDQAYVVRSNGTLAVFRITSVRLYRKSRFPFQAVYGPVPYPALRLITCGGTFDYTTRSYLSNVVAFGQEVIPKRVTRPS
jgi:sortase (surface protein transpeptidase)